jgi:hypothetical protein
MRKLRYSAAALAGATCLAFMLAGTASADVDEDAGGASGVLASVNTPIGTVNVPPTPNVNLPAGGGSLQQTLVSLGVPGVVSAGVLSVSTNGSTGPGGSASSSADVANADAFSGVATAGVIHSECLSDEAGSSGDASLVNAAVAGTPIAANPPANTEIPVPGVGSVFLNEQAGTNDPGVSTSIVVSAVHVSLNGLAGDGDIVISQSGCGVAGAEVLGVSVIGPAGPASASAADAINGNPNLAG